ncbi:MAG TPA: L-histidine N(alpha)-methyltransferase [Bryobacteraceae bacterium]|nr:L-histidine N(alpha)-methyltransferase [Bryobacteraceae bacterium]
MFAAAVPRVSSAFAQDVAEGLTNTPQKTLPSAWLYDDVGSALFEAITVLPEYGLTRADGALLERSAGEIAECAGHPELIFELGSGAGRKTRHILAALRNRIRYMPIDISRAALENCESALRSMDRVTVDPIEATYLDGIERALTHRSTGDRVMILFLGSTIGNFSPAEAQTFLHRIRQRLLPGDSLLLGADLVKPRAKLIRAYDDSLGVTAAFNLNLLGRINRELDGEFDLAKFAHEARYSERGSRIEMHLRSRVAQKVKIGALDLRVSFRRDETIWTESSHKFRAEEIRWLGEQAGWQSERQWIDDDWGFAETLFSCPR